MSQQKIIILNGTSSAGKTTLAKHLVQKTNGVFEHFSHDIFREELRKNTPTKIERHSLNIPELFTQAVHNILYQQKDIVLDVVYVSAKDFDSLVSEFSAYAVTTVRLKAPLGVLNERERLRSNTSEKRPERTAEINYLNMYYSKTHSPYDLEFDSGSMTTQEIGDAIIGHLKL